jgi:hypothetical protein
LALVLHIFGMVSPPLCHGLLVSLGDGKPPLPLAMTLLDLLRHKVRLQSDHLGFH